MRRLVDTPWNLEELPLGAHVVYAVANEDGSSVTQTASRLGEIKDRAARIRAAASIIDAAWESVEQAGLFVEEILAHWTEGGQVACARCGHTFFDDDDHCERCAFGAQLSEPEEMHE